MILLVEQCGPQCALLAVVTLPLEVNPHILSLADTKEERKNTFCGHYVESSHQKPFHIVENRRNNYFSPKTELRFLPESSYGLMFSFLCFSISHSISHIYVAGIKICQSKATYSEKYLFEADGSRGIRVHCSKLQAWWQEQKAEKSHLSYKHEAESELEMVQGYELFSFLFV